MSPNEHPAADSQQPQRTLSGSGPDNEPPFTIGDAYDVTKRLGRGGMGDVYLACERALDRQVAIKLLPQDLARSSEFVRRFKAEAAVAARLVHPNIVRIHRIGEEAGHHFFVMDFIEGESLASLLARRSRLDCAEAVAIAEHVLSALAAAHDLGVVHRDVKPGNILIDQRKRRALLADFGLAKSLESCSTRMTATGVVMGTLDYSSPEQGRGQTVDGRSDLYSVGVLLYQILSGRLPFIADNPMALIFQHVHEPLPALGEAAPHVPAVLVSIVERLLAKSPGDRYESAGQVLADLRSFDSAIAQPAIETNCAVSSAPSPLLRDCPPLPASLTSISECRWWERARLFVQFNPWRAIACVSAMVAIVLVAVFLLKSPKSDEPGPSILARKSDESQSRSSGVQGPLENQPRFARHRLKPLNEDDGRPQVPRDKSAPESKPDLATTQRPAVTSDGEAERTKAGLSKAVADAFVRAHALVFQNAADDLAQTLQAVHAELPRLELCIRPGEVVWNHTQIESEPGRFAAFAFKSPLDQPADVCWVFSCREQLVNWDILPVEGTMQGFTSYHRINYPHFRDGNVPVYDYANVQSLTGGRIVPGKEYVIWMAQQRSQKESRLAAMLRMQKAPNPSFSDAQRAAINREIQDVQANPKEEAVPLSIAMRLVPTENATERSAARAIADQIGDIFYESHNTVIHRHSVPIHSICLTPDGSEVVLVDGTDVIRFWNRESRQQREFVGDGQYSWVSVSADGKRLAAGGGDQSVEVSLWHLESGKRMPNLDIEWAGHVRDALAAHPGGYVEKVGSLTFINGSDRALARIFASTITEDATKMISRLAQHDAVLWDLEQNRELHRIRLGQSIIDGEPVADGRKILIARRGKAASSGLSPVEIALLDWETEQTSKPIALGYGTKWGRLLVSPDEKMVGVCFDRKEGSAYEVYDVAEGNLVTSVETQVRGQTISKSNVQIAAWSKDSRFLALGFVDSSVRLWDVRENRLRDIYRGHIRPICGLTFTPDGRFLLSASEDGTVREWALERPVLDSISDSLGISLVSIPAGEFVMGTVAGYLDRSGYRKTKYEHEQPQHRVRISQSFYISQHEVTVGQFRAFADASGYKTTAEKSGGGFHMADLKEGFQQKPQYTWRAPGFTQTDKHPVVQVSWHDAQAFCQWLGEREHVQYRLPTEAEWEYACRAGLEHEMWNLRPLKGRAMRSEDIYGNVADAAIRSHFGRFDVAAAFDDGYAYSAPVGVCNLNDFGLYDMHGNVFEWCLDWHDPMYYRNSPDIDPKGPPDGVSRVLRGGGFYYHVDLSRSSHRNSGRPEEAHSGLGFRVVREIEDR